MKIAVIADIHGNYRALEAVLRDISTQKVEKIISLGDNIGYGPEPEFVVNALIENNVTSIMGNHELALVSQSYFRRLNAIPQESLILSLKMLSAQSISWLKSLQPVYLLKNIRFVHGSPPQSVTAYLYSPTETRLRRLFSQFSESICFVGHTHTLDCFAMTRQKITISKLGIGAVQLAENGRYILIPGSVGQPRDVIDYSAKYCIFDQEKKNLTIRSVEYDVDETIKLLKERGFHQFNATRLKWSGK